MIEINLFEEKKEDTEPFEFEYTIPTYDWYDIKKVKIAIKDYTYFRLERRFGKTWWLVGKNYNDNNFEWTEKTIGELQRIKDVIRFIKWAKRGRNNKLIEIKAISGSLDIIEAIEELIDQLKKEER